MGSGPTESKRVSIWFPAGGNAVRMTMEKCQAEWLMNQLIRQGIKLSDDTLESSETIDWKQKYDELSQRVAALAMLGPSASTQSEFRPYGNPEILGR